MSKSPSLRRIQADVRELALDPSDRYHASPLEDDMFEWYVRMEQEEGESKREKGAYLTRQNPNEDVWIPCFADPLGCSSSAGTLPFVEPMTLISKEASITAGSW
jgi:hypothetical protein